MKKFFKNLMPMLLLVAGLGISPNASAIGFKKGNIFFDATGLSDMKSYTYFAVGHDSYNSCYEIKPVKNTNYYYGWCSNGDWWSGCNFFTVFSATSSWDSGSGYEDIKKWCGGYYAGKYTSSYDIDSDNIYELIPSGTSKGASFSINYREGINDLNTTQTVTVQLSTNGGSSYSTASKGLASVSASTYYFDTKWAEADATGSISLTSGSSTVSGSTTAAKTSTVSLSVSNVATGYTFVGWYYSNGTLISTNTTASYVPKENKTVYARFKENRYDITATVNDANMGSATPTTATAMGQISGGNITATNNPGYHFVNWTLGTAAGTFGSSITASTTFKPTQAGTVVANFAENLTSVTISSNGNGTVSPTSANVGVTTTQSVTATPADGYHFASWAVTGNADIKDATTSNPVTLYGNGSGSTGTLAATFAETTYPITVAAGANGSVASASVSAGQITSVALPTATPDDGYNFKNWTATEGITITNPTSADGATIKATKAGTVTANFENAATYSLTVAAGTGIASVTGSQDDITLGQSYPITATVKAGYTWSGWARTSGAGTAAFADASSQNTNVTVTVGSVEVTASATPNANTPYKVYHYQQNLADDDYTLVDTDNLTGTTDASVTPDVKDYEGFTAPSTTTVTIAGDGSTVVEYQYARKSYTLTWAGLEGATVTGGTSAGSVKYGAELTAPTVSKTGYNFTGWSPAVPATMPADNSTYTAQWQEILYTITLTNATVASVQAGIATHPSITANAAPVGQKFQRWNTTGGATVANATSANTTVSATAEGTVTAVYEDVPTVFFDNTNTNWSNVYVYLMKQDVWEKSGSGKGAAISGEYYEYHQMTQIGTSKIYYYSYTTASPTQYIAFSSTDMHEYGEFHGNNGAYRGDFNECQPMFIPDGTHSKTNETEYYSSGRWTSYSTASEIYMVGIDDDWSERAQYQFEKETITGTSYTLDVTLSEIGHNYTFKLRKCGDGEWYGVDQEEAAITSNHCTDIQFYGGNDYANCTLISTVAGTYTFTYDITTKKLSVEYPAMPVPASITVTKERYFGEDKIDNFIATDPYKVYTDEQIKLTIDEVAAPTGCTTYYQFGENAASTERTYTITNPTTAADQSIEAKVFFRPNAGGEDGEAKSETIAYQGMAKPSLNLTTSWSTHNDEAQEGVDVPENVTVHYNAGNYSGPATVTRSKDGGDPVNFFIVESGDQKSETYALPDKNVQRQTFVATAEVNGRTFTATKTISVYRLVEITITDEDNLMTNYYMWEDGTNPTREEQAWPGKSFFSTLGNAHIFYVKYPSYTHFVLNNGEQAGEGDAIQTVNVALPEQSTCYTIGTQVTGEEDPDKGKYQVETAECPNKLYVGDIDDVSAVQGEGVIVSPQVDIDPLLDANNLVISFNYLQATGISCDQRGRSFMVTATAGTGTYNIQVTYSIPGAVSVTKPVTINVTSAIMIQAKYGNLAWSDHNEIYIHYWGTDINATQKMTWKDYVGEDSNKQDRVYARIPLGSNNKINFQIYAWNMDDDKQWHITKDVIEVTASGCYTITPDDCEGCKRNINRESDNCWTAYYVEIDMNNGTVYRSNTVEDLSQTVSFFAPGASEETAKAGLVRIICNGSQTATIATNTFDKSGIYTAKIAEGGTGLTNVAYYTGDYYIRTDGVDGGWSDYKKASHKFTNFSLYNGAKYNYYWVANVKKVSESQTFNIKGCVGNEYNENLANMIESDNYTDGTGNIQVDEYGVNLRFGYNPQTNHFERAILRGAGNNYFLNIQGDNIYNDEDCNDQVLNETNYNSHPEYSKFNDVSDWVYEKLIFVQIDNEHQSSSVLLKSKAFNGQILYQLGYTTDILGRSTLIPAEKVVMGAGSTNGKYTLRVIYDYKTNRLSATWEPSGVISEVKKVDSDILFVSNEGGEVKQITFGGDSATARLESLQSVMYVLEMENDYVPKADAPDAQYWIALPFECKISDIFGIENYITLDENRIAQSGWWGIMRYRGDLRAQKGWFIEDTPEGFWEWMYPTETLMPGEGYILYVEKSSLSWNSITVEEPCEDGEGCTDGKKSVQKYVKRFYFPSLVEGFTMNRSGEASSKVNYPNQPCNITSPVNRRAEDSNWKVIAPKSYNNVSIKSAEDQDKDHILEGPGFIYTYDAAKAKGSRYTAIATEGFEFKAFHGYMAQYGGTITWNPYSKTEHPTSAPYYGEEPSFKGGMLTIELVQNNEQLDRTFVKLSKNGTEGFDQNLDLTKITESCSQIASVSENVVYAGNTLPLNTELVPLNVKVTAKGTYDIALSESLNGLEVRLYDAFEQTTTPLDMMSATITLDKGEYKDRFFLQLKQKGSDTPTSFDGKLEQYNLPTDKTQKLLINDQIYLINAGRIYNASGTKVK